MKPTICSRCKKNVAVIFITKVENGKSTNEGLCLKCARELGIKQVDDIVERMGITDEDLEGLNSEMMALMQPEDEEDEDDIGSRTATFPHMNRLFGGPEAIAPKEEPKEKSRSRQRTSPRSRSTSSWTITASISPPEPATTPWIRSSAARWRRSVWCRSSTVDRRTTLA